MSYRIRPALRDWTKPRSRRCEGRCASSETRGGTTT